MTRFYAYDRRSYYFNKRALRALEENDHDVHDSTRQLWLDNVACIGNKQNVSSCDHAGCGNHYCYHNENAGVECSSTGNVIILLQYRMIILHKSCCFYYFTEILLNLQGPPNATGSGLVEIFYHMDNEEPSVIMTGIIMMP